MPHKVKTQYIHMEVFSILRYFAYTAFLLRQTMMLYIHMDEQRVFMLINHDHYIYLDLEFLPCT